GLAGVGQTAARRYVAPAVATNDGTLVMSTNPPGARLFVDGVERGVTPTTLTVPRGSRRLALLREGARLYRGEVIVPLWGARVQQDLPPAAPDLTRRGRAALRGDCERDVAARGSVDGVDTGLGCNTPRLYVEAGAHTVEVYFARGDSTHTERVNVPLRAQSTHVRVKRP
ncbi:MAG: PEGA domain-containing protein, partial [Deltaproteobacteria bacterium]|nr:PEGA domain-containing protein [Deltaproteobacteria bacterium]